MSAEEPQETYEAQAATWLENVKNWRGFSGEAQFGDGVVQIVQRAPFKLRNSEVDRDLLRTSDEEVFFWAGEFGEEARQGLLSEGFLLFENRCYLPIVDAFRPENKWVWR